MDNLEIVLKRFFEVLINNYEDLDYDIFEKITLDKDLFYNLKYCVEEEYVKLFCNGIKVFEGTENYNNIVFNLIELYPFSKEILEELTQTGSMYNNKECYIVRKEELDKEIKEIAEKNEENRVLFEKVIEKEKELFELEKKYTKDFYNEMEKELQKEEKKIIERKREIEKLDEKIKKILKEELEEFEKDSDVKEFREIRDITKKLISNKKDDDEEFKFSE